MQQSYLQSSADINPTNGHGPISSAEKYVVLSFTPRYYETFEELRQNYFQLTNLEEVVEGTSRFVHKQPKAQQEWLKLAILYLYLEQANADHANFQFQPSVGWQSYKIEDPRHGTIIGSQKKSFLAVNNQLMRDQGPQLVLEHITFEGAADRAGVEELPRSALINAPEDHPYKSHEILQIGKSQPCFANPLLLRTASTILLRVVKDSELREQIESYVAGRNAEVSTFKTKQR